MNEKMSEGGGRGEEVDQSKRRMAKVGIAIGATMLGIGDRSEAVEPPKENPEATKDSVLGFTEADREVLRRGDPKAIETARSVFIEFVIVVKNLQESLKYMEEEMKKREKEKSPDGSETEGIRVSAKTLAGGVNLISQNIALCNAALRELVRLRPEFLEELTRKEKPKPKPSPVQGRTIAA